MHIYGLQENGTDEPICRTVIERLAQTIKNLSATQETLVQSLGWEDPVEKGMVIHFSILACGIPWTEEPGGLQFMG